jgi:GntR family transcriptional regulator
MKLDPSSDIPLHRQIEALIRALVNSGNYDQGELLPRELELASRFNVARNTVRQAINKMVIEGVLVRKRGVGTTLAPKTIATNLSNWQSFTGEMQSLGVPMVVLSLHSAEEAADDIIAQALDLRKGRKVVRFEKILGTPDNPMVYFVSWFHPRTGLSAASDFSKPLYQLLQQTHGIYARRSSEELKAVLCDRLVASLLHTREGDPLLLRKRTVYDDQNRIIEYNIGYYRGDKFSYRIDMGAA